jgi:hypothetical protein
MASLAFVSVNALRPSPQSASGPVRLPAAQGLVTVPPFAGLGIHGPMPSLPSRPDDSASRYASVSRKPIRSRVGKTEGGKRPAVTAPAAVQEPVPDETPGVVQPPPAKKPPRAKSPLLPSTVSPERVEARARLMSKRWQVGDVADEVWVAFLDLLRDYGANGQALPKVLKS